MTIELQPKSKNADTAEGGRPAISVVVSALNEEENLPILRERIASAVEPLGLKWELVVTNDGSMDGTREVLDRMADEDARVKVIHFRRNCGQTAAMMAGFHHASGEVLIAMDADLQNDPSDIPRLLEKVREGYDVVSGWRKERKDHAIKRNFTSRLANGLISNVSKVHLHDYGCSLKAYRREVLQGINLYGEMHRFIPIYAYWNGARITEIPVLHHARQHGQSKYGLNRVGKVILDLMVVMFLHRYAHKPMYVFGTCGMISVACSVAAMAWAVWLKIFAGKSFSETPLPLVVLMGVILGMMCILMGLLAELSIRTYHESQEKPTYLIAGMRNLRSKPSRKDDKWA